MNPVVIALNGNAGDIGILQGLECFNGTGEGAGQDLTSVEQVTGNQDKIYLLGNGVGHNAAQHAEEVFVAFDFTGRGAVSFTEMDVSGVEEIHRSIIFLNVFMPCISITTNKVDFVGLALCKDCTLIVNGIINLKASELRWDLFLKNPL
jgi:hypothetical protein